MRLFESIVILINFHFNSCYFILSALLFVLFQFSNATQTCNLMGYKVSAFQLCCGLLSNSILCFAHLSLFLVCMYVHHVCFLMLSIFWLFEFHISMLLVSLFFQEARSYAEENGLFFMETSAKTAINVNDIFHAIGMRPFFVANYWNAIHRSHRDASTKLGLYHYYNLVELLANFQLFS